jgi:translation initiation factor IF-3
VNEEIYARKLLLIGADGHKYGEIGTDEARAIAEEQGFDLVEVSPEASPPVAKLMDYGKFKYEQQKKAAEARKKQKVIEIKEIKMRPTIDDHDYDVKMRSMRRFFDEGDKVKVTLRFRGREMAHMNLGMELLGRIQKDVDPVAKVEQSPRTEGRQMMMVLAPR